MLLAVGFNKCHLGVFRTLIIPWKLKCPSKNKKLFLDFENYPNMKRKSGQMFSVIKANNFKV